MRSPAPIDLGLGLVGIGRPWGAVGRDVPDEAHVEALLAQAVALGIRRFDTAPAYGLSEARLGRFLGALAPAARASLSVSTKCGEQFDLARERSIVDHHPDALRASVDRSLDVLGPVEVVLIHKCTPDVLRDDRVTRALEAYRGHGVGALGASVADVATGHAALEHPAIDVLQLPCHLGREELAPLLPLALERGKRVLVNRPFGTGQVLLREGAPGSTSERVEAAFSFLLAQRFVGTILMGTKTPHHLADNVAAFERALGAGEGRDG